MVKHAIILAGGKGERLRPYTDDRPKPLVEIAGKPILAYQIAQLKAAGVAEVIFTLNYKKEKVMEELGDGSKLGVKITYSIEDSPLGRGGAIKKAMQQIEEPYDNVIGLNGDNLWKVDISEVIKLHEDRQALLTMVFSELRSPYGLADINDQDEVTGYREKPALPYWLNDGIYILSKEIVELLPDLGDLEDHTFPKLPANKFMGFKNQVYWRGVDTVKDLLEAEKEVVAIFGQDFIDQL